MKQLHGISFSFHHGRGVTVWSGLTRPILGALAVLAGASLSLNLLAEEVQTISIPAWLTQPMAMTDAVNLALNQNGTILRGKSDLEASYGVVIQTKAVSKPTLKVSGNYQYSNETEQPPFPAPVPEHNWTATIQLVQSIYEGGRIQASLRSAKLTQEQAVLQYQTVIADALLQVRIAYFDVLQAADQIEVNEASVKLLTQQLDDQKRRYEAGTVPRFNVLQAEVELSNQRPKLIQARNAHRIAKNNLVSLLGYRVPPTVWEDIPLNLTDHLDATPYSVELPVAIAKALENRTELATLRKEESLRKEAVIAARAGQKPSVQIFGGYGSRNSSFTTDPSREINGASAGAQVSWNIFDGDLTKGKIAQARSLQTGAKVDLENQTRNIELEVRTDYSNFIEAREILESQKKVQEQAEEALRLATARSDAGTGTQLDVLSAQTSLTQARSTQVKALHDYDVARVRLERAMGLVTWKKG